MFEEARGEEGIFEVYWSMEHNLINKGWKSRIHVKDSCCPGSAS